MALTERQKRMRQAEKALAIQSNIQTILLEIENRLLKKRIMVSQPILFKKNEGLYKNIEKLVGTDLNFSLPSTKERVRKFFLSKIVKKRKLSRVLNKFEDKTELYETLLPLAIQDICGLTQSEIKKRFAK